MSPIPRYIVISLLFLVLLSYISLRVGHGSFFPALFIPIVVFSMLYGTRGGLLSASLFSIYTFVFIYFVLDHRDTVPMVLLAVVVFLVVGYIVGKLRDLWKETKVQNEQIRKTVQEKEFLMRELNHRVKNNLLMVSSLISMKEASLEREVDLSDLRSQVNAIEKAHETLQQSDKVTHVNLSEYVAGVLEGVFQYSESRRVTVENRIPAVSVSTKAGLPIGLIVNELATNAHKHGFTPDHEHRFSVAMEKDSEGEHYILTISNTGHPVPDDVDIEKPRGLGLRLILTLVQQLEGTLELQRKPRPVFRIRFPVSWTHDL